MASPRHDPIVEFAGSGDDQVYGLDNDDRLHGENGRDQLWGRQGDDRLFGGNGKDALYGGDDDDLLRGENGICSVRAALLCEASEAAAPCSRGAAPGAAAGPRIGSASGAAAAASKEPAGVHGCDGLLAV